ncbi:importin-9-like [Lineus longissimus]|uniref:importin-9-like n=1 Tax=Lineus longissimus TaxID=88925 RepID=UPI002B4E64DE
MAVLEDRARMQQLKEALFESLTAILSPMQEVRTAGEEQIKALEVTEEFGVFLAEFVVDRSGPLAVRQLSSVLLKQYVEAHWSRHSEKFRSPETSDAAKKEIRRILPHGLGESISKVRSSVAYAVSAIAHWDWPEEWPDLLKILMESLTNGDVNAVHGAMRVLSEFCREVTDTQMPQVAPVILPEMFKIFMHADRYSIRTRSRAVDIVNTCADLIGTMSELHRNAAKQLLFPVLPQFTEALVEALRIPDGPTSDSGLKMEILKALTTLLKNFPKFMNQYLSQVLAPVWKTLEESVNIYVGTVVNDTEDHDDVVDSDGEILGFESLVFSVFEFIHGLIDTSKFRNIVKKYLDQLVYFVILYMQITEEQVKKWTQNPDQFVEDEDDDTFSYSVRISAQDLLLSLAHEFPTLSAKALCNAISTHIEQAEVAKNSGNKNWWKIHESVLLAMGSVKTLLLDAISSGKLQFDVPKFLTVVVLNDMSLPDLPFLLGRCMWTSSRFAGGMSPQLLQRFLHVTVDGLLPKHPTSVRISAVRAVFNFCDYLKQTNQTNLISPCLAHIMVNLVDIGKGYSSDVLALCLETLTVVITVDKSFTASHESLIGPLAIATFIKYSSDPLIVSLSQDIFKELSQNEACQGPLQQRIVPTLVSILQAHGKATGPNVMPSTSVALEVVETLVRNSVVPLPEPLVVHAFPAVCRCVLTTDDHSTIQYGGECLRAYVSLALDQITGWHDEQGHNGLYYVIQAVSKILDPKTDENTATFVGRLVSILIVRLGNNLGDNLDLMLRMVLSKLMQAESLSVIQSLVMVFAQLVHHHLEGLLNFLCSVPDPSGKPALEFVLNEWLAKQHLFFGSYEGKVSTVALAKLLAHAIKTDDTRFHHIEVNGDPIHDQSEVIRTRSKAANAPEQWTKIPVLVKIYKLLINELSNQLETNMSTRVSAGDDECDEDDVWEDDDEEDGNDIEDSEQTLASVLSHFAPAADYAGFDLDGADEDEDDDPDVMNDPINQIDLQAYLTDFLLDLSKQQFYGLFSQHHNDLEKKVLQSIGIQG